ncbi:MAG: uroporphyrinogen decarboxylase family protein [Victivallaceae bacterium]|nr:uroporphyrinogen decarboxylase family protein [Victivallaceae bacterium]
MNGRERTLAAVNGDAIDRIPVAQHNFMFAVKHTGLSWKDYAFNPAKAAQALADTAYDFGYDCIIIDFDTCALAEAMGANIVFPENEPARIELDAIRSLSEIAEIPLPDPDKDARLPLWLETTRQLRKIVGDDLAIMARADQGPFGLLFLLRGVQELMFDLFEQNEEVILKTLEHCKNAGVRFAEAQLQCGADITSIGDSAAGESLISPNMYKQFAQPFEKKYKEYLGEGLLSLHICGKTNNIVEAMVDTGCDILELDHLNNLDHTFKLINKKACVFGNIDPSSILCQGTVKMVEKACEDAILSARKHEARFVLCPGCMVNHNTPPENIKAMSEIVKKV